jgi:hypothetical protein
MEDTLQNTEHTVFRKTSQKAHPNENKFGKVYLEYTEIPVILHATPWVTMVCKDTVATM